MHNISEAAAVSGHGGSSVKNLLTTITPVVGSHLLSWIHSHNTGAHAVAFTLNRQINATHMLQHTLMLSMSNDTSMLLCFGVLHSRI